MRLYWWPGQIPELKGLPRGLRNEIADQVVTTSRIGPGLYVARFIAFLGLAYSIQRLIFISAETWLLAYCATVVLTYYVVYMLCLNFGRERIAEYLRGGAGKRQFP